MKRITTFLIIALAILCFLVQGPVLAKPQTMKAVSFLPKDHPLCAMIHVWVDRVNKDCAESIKIDWTGGPEVIPGFDQAEAVRNNLATFGNPSRSAFFAKARYFWLA